MRRRVRSMPGARTLLLAALLLSLHPAAGSAPAAAQTPPAEAPAEDSASQAPAGAGEVLVDEETGVSYRIERVPRIEGTYRWVNETKIRMRHGVHLEVVDHNEDEFWVKAYFAPRREPERKPGKTEEEKAAEREEMVAL